MGAHEDHHNQVVAASNTGLSMTTVKELFAKGWTFTFKPHEVQITKPQEEIE